MQLTCFLWQLGNGEDETPFNVGFLLVLSNHEKNNNNSSNKTTLNPACESKFTAFFSRAFLLHWDHLRWEVQRQERGGTKCYWWGLEFKIQPTLTGDADCAADASLIFTAEWLSGWRLGLAEMSKVRLRSEQIFGVIPTQASACASADLAVVTNLDSFFKKKKETDMQRTDIHPNNWG